LSIQCHTIIAAAIPTQEGTTHFVVSYIQTCRTREIYSWNFILRLSIAF